VFPKNVHQMIKQDVEQILWRSNPEIHSDEKGSGTRTHHWIAEHAWMQPKDEGGAGTMDWDSHVSAYYAQWIRRYLDPRQAPWKVAVDHIFRDQIGTLGTGRAFIVSSHFQNADLLSSIPAGATLLRKAVREFRAMNLEMAALPESAVALPAQPIFGNPNFKVEISSASIKSWSERLKTRRLKDLVDEKGVRFSAEHWEQWIYKWRPTDRAEQQQAAWADAKVEEIEIIHDSISAEIWDALAKPTPQPAEGEIWAIVEGGEQDDDPEEITWVRIVKVMPLTYHTLWVDTSGRPHDTGIEWEDSDRHDHTQLVKAVLWPKVQKGGKTKLGADELEDDEEKKEEDDRITWLIQGTECAAYPANSDFQLVAPRRPKTDPPLYIAQLTISNITKVLMQELHALQKNGGRPNCEKGWQKRVPGFPLPWPKIWKSMTTGLTSDDDEKTFHKLLHRALFEQQRNGRSHVPIVRGTCRKNATPSLLHAYIADVGRDHGSLPKSQHEQANVANGTDSLRGVDT